MRFAALLVCAVGVSVLPACQNEQALSRSSATPASTLPEASGVGPVELDQPEQAGRPTEFKKLQTWLATRGLEFTGDGVQIDEVGAAEVRAERAIGPVRDSLARSAELLKINAVVRAIGFARDAVLTDPTSSQAHHALGTALRAKRKDDKALDAFTTAARLVPGSPAIQADLGDARNRMGDLNGAIAAYSRAVDLDPDAGQAYVRLAVLNYYAGDDVSAWASLREADRLGATVPPQFRILLSERTPEG